MTDPTEQARHLAQRYIDALNERQLESLDDFLAPDMRSHLRIGDIIGADRFVAIMEMMYEAFPALWYEIDDLIVVPGRAVIRYHFDAVHRGPFLGVPASHRMVHLAGVEILHVEGGRIVEFWNYADVMGLAAQIRAADPLALRLDD